MLKNPHPVRSLKGRMWALTYWAAVRDHPSRGVGSLTLVDSNQDPTDDDAFFRTVEEALDLLRQTDPRRFRRVESAFRLIINVELISLGVFDPILNSCRIDFGSLRVFRERLGQEWLVAKVATLLVHEATHGYQHQRGFKYKGSQRSRLERMCVREEHRFAGRLDERVRDLHPLVEPFDPSGWELLWYGSIWKKLKAFLARTKESRRDGEARAGRPWVEDPNDGTER